MVTTCYLWPRAADAPEALVEAPSLVRAAAQQMRDLWNYYSWVHCVTNAFAYEATGNEMPEDDRALLEAAEGRYREARHAYVAARREAGLPVWREAGDGSS